MLVQEVVLMANDLADLLDQWEVSDDKKEKRRLLERSVLLSMRAVQVLAQEPLVGDPEGYLESIAGRHFDNLWGIAEEIRHDYTTVTLFLGSECRMLQDLGLLPVAVQRLRDALERAIMEARERPEGLRGRIDELLAELRNELRRLYDDRRHERLMSRVLGVFEALGGALVIAANAAAGAVGAPASGGLTIVVGVPLSTAVGTEVISRGVDRAKGQ